MHAALFARAGQGASHGNRQEGRGRVPYARVYLTRSFSSCCFPAFQPETSWRYPVTLLIWTTSWLPHSGQTGAPQRGQYSMLETISWEQWQ